MENDFITPEEAAKVLRVNTHTVYRALRAGKLPGGKVGAQWRISRADLEAHMRGKRAVAGLQRVEGGAGR
jgi:excisionase family DNA binding protein